MTLSGAPKAPPHQKLSRFRPKRHKFVTFSTKTNETSIKNSSDFTILIRCTSEPTMDSPPPSSRTSKTPTSEPKTLYSAPSPSKFGNVPNKLFLEPQNLVFSLKFRKNPKIRPKVRSSLLTIPDMSLIWLAIV